MLKKTIKVNGDLIPESAIEFELERLTRFYVDHGMAHDNIRAKLPELIEQAQNQAIGTKLLLDQAAKLDIKVDEAAVDKQIADIVDQVGGQEAFQQALAAQKTSPEQFREEIRRGKRVEALVAKAAEGVPEPTEAEIKAYFDAHKAEFNKAERVLAQHILITPDGETEASKQEALDKIKAIRERILGGAKFEDEASAHSMCPSGKNGGSLGWFSRGMMVPEFDTAVFSMKDGETSDVIQTQFGYHIIRRTDHQDAGEASFDEVHDQVRDLLRHTRRGQAVTAYVEDMKSKAKIEIS